MQWLIDIVYDAVTTALGHVWDIKDIVPHDEQIIIGDGSTWTGEQFGVVRGRYPPTVDRGDANDHDFRKVNLTTDGAWHDLDLSNIIPIGTKLVAMRVSFASAPVAFFGIFRTKGATFAYNAATNRTQVSGIFVDADLFVAPDSNRKVEYKFSNGVFVEIYITVKAWWT